MIFTSQVKEITTQFQMNLKEIEALYDFAKASTGNGRFSILSSNTGIGNALKVLDTNGEQDITDYESW